MNLRDITGNTEEEEKEDTPILLHKDLFVQNNLVENSFTLLLKKPHRTYESDLHKTDLGQSFEHQCHKSSGRLFEYQLKYDKVSNSTGTLLPPMDRKD